MNYRHPSFGFIAKKIHCILGEFTVSRFLEHARYHLHSHYSPNNWQHRRIRNALIKYATYVPQLSKEVTMHLTVCRTSSITTRIEVLDLMVDLFIISSGAQRAFSADDGVARLQSAMEDATLIGRVEDVDKLALLTSRAASCLRKIDVGFPSLQGWFDGIGLDQLIRTMQCVSRFPPFRRYSFRPLVHPNVFLLPQEF